MNETTEKSEIMKNIVKRMKAPLRKITENNEEIEKKLDKNSEEDIEINISTDLEILDIEAKLSKTPSKMIYITMVINIMLIMVIMTENQISDIADLSVTVRETFINRYLDFNLTIRLGDSYKMSNSEEIYNILINTSIIDNFYKALDRFDQLDLLYIPEAFRRSDMSFYRLNNSHYYMHNNYLLGTVIYAVNNTPSETTRQIINEIYLNLKNSDGIKDNKIFEDNTTNNSKEFSDIFIYNQVFRRYDDNQIGILLPGNITSSQAYFILNEYQVL